MDRNGKLNLAGSLVSRVSHTVMNRPVICRVIQGLEPASGAWNMGVDEVLLDAAVCRGECFLRWYRWSEPTVSLGYFQKPAELEAAGEFASLPWVKRLSGGGAILHHHEWTYSCALPPGHPLVRSPYELYAAVHERIIAVLEQYGIVSQLRGTALSGGRQSFLCFGRGDPNDVILKGHKILGSAQRRRRGAILQHGSLLMQRSQYAPQFPGIRDLAATGTLDDCFVTDLTQSVVSLLGDETVMTDFTESHLAAGLARRVVGGPSEKHGSQASRLNIVESGE